MFDSKLLEAIAASSSVRSLLAKARFDDRAASPCCAVSGGADSTALAVLSVAFANALGSPLPRLVHVDHGLRSSSAADADIVVVLAERLGIECVVHRLALDDGPNLEERARDARYSVLETGVCTGHTLDDLAETVVLHLLRGAGLDGVASMARSRPGGPRRPLLGLRRAETESLCTSLGLDTVDDTMNVDRRFRRVRVRHELMPTMSRVADRDAAVLLARHAEVTADDIALLEELSETIDPTARWGLRDVPLPLARRAVRRWLTTGGVGDGRVVDAASLERVLAVAQGASPGCDVAGGWRVHRTDGALRLIAPPPTHP